MNDSTETSRPQAMGLLASGSLTLVTRIVVFGLSLVTNVLLARALGPSGRGVYALALLVPSLMVLVANFGILNAIVYYVGKGLVGIGAVVGQSLSLAVLLGIAAYLVQLAVMIPFGARLVPGVPIVFVLTASASVPVVLAFNFLQAIFQARERFVDYNIIQVVSYAGVVLLLVPLVFALRLGTWGAVLAWTFSSVPTLVACLWLVRRYSAIGFALHRSLYTRLLGFGLMPYLASLTTFLNYRLDIFIVNLFGSTGDVGIYTVGTGLAETIWYLATAAATVLAPRAAAAATEEAEQLTATVSRIVFSLSLAGALALALTAPLLLRVFFGQAFVRAAVAVWVLLPGVVALSVAKVLSSYLLGRNRIVVDWVAASVGLVATIALDVTLIPRLGFVGAALASTLAYLLTVAVSMGWVVTNSGLTVGSLLLPRRSDLLVVANRFPRR